MNIQKLNHLTVFIIYYFFNLRNCFFYADSYNFFITFPMQ